MNHADSLCDDINDMIPDSVGDDIPDPIPITVSNNNNTDTNNDAERMVIYDVWTQKCERAIAYYHQYPRAQIFVLYAKTTNLGGLRAITANYRDRIYIVDEDSYAYGDHVFPEKIDICYVNEETSYENMHRQLPMHIIRCIEGRAGVLYDNTATNLRMFCTFHKKYFVDAHNFYFTFVGVNELMCKITNRNPNTIYEYAMKNYTPFLQKRGFKDASVYLHVFWNEMHEHCEMVGFCRYDTYHDNTYENIDKHTLYMMKTMMPIVKNGHWSYLMTPQTCDCNYLLEHYNKHYSTEYNMASLENMPLSIWQTNIYPVKMYEKLCDWLQDLAIDVYVLCNQQQRPMVFGDVGVYTERAIGIFNAIEIYEGAKYAAMSVKTNHYMVTNESESTKTIMDKYHREFHCELVNASSLDGYMLVGMEQSMFSRRTDGGVTYIHYNFNDSKPLAIYCFDDVPHTKIQNVIHDNLDRYNIYFKENGEQSGLFSVAVRPRRKYYVCSFGGTGSTLLANKLGYYGDTEHVHSRNPPEKLEHIGTKNGGRTYKEWFNGCVIPDDEVGEYDVIYIYRNPVFPIFSRFWNPKHLTNIEIAPTVKINDVVFSKKDHYKIGEFHDNYTTPNPRRNYRIHCVKYEDLFEKQAELSELLGIGALQLVKKESNYSKYSQLVNVMEFIYKDVIDKMNAREFIFTV